MAPLLPTMGSAGARLYLAVPNPARRILSVKGDKGPGLPTVVAQEAARREVRLQKGPQTLPLNMSLATSTPPPSTGPEKDAQRVLHVHFHTASLCQRLILTLPKGHGPPLLPDDKEKEVAKANHRQRRHALLPQASAPLLTIAINSSRTVCAPTRRTVNNASTHT